MKILKSLILLEQYYKWWLKGEDLTKNDLNKKLEETGVLDPIEDISCSDLERFYNLYPAIFFAMNYCGRNSPELPALKSIALDYPNADYARNPSMKRNFAENWDSPREHPFTCFIIYSDMKNIASISLQSKRGTVPLPGAQPGS